MANGWAKCRYCKLEMKPGAGCKVKTYDDIPGKGPLKRLPYDGDGQKCHDCNVRPGQLHHPGCDMELCPACRGQAISCGCSDGDSQEQSEP
jgi:hypothetical protein